MISNIILKDCEEIISNRKANLLNQKSILLTGASGLIGTYISYSLKCLVDKGYNLHLYIVSQRNLPKYLEDFSKYTWVKVLQGDLCDDSFVDSFPNVDYIIHAAGYGQPFMFVKDPDKTIKLNTVVTFKLIEKLNLNGKFLFLSSAAVYCDLDKEIYFEEDIGVSNTTHPRACYIEGKRCGEAICNAYREKGIDIKSVRLSNAFGPGVRITDKRALNSFIFRGFKGDIELMDSGEAKRIYCYVTDAVKMIWNIFFEGKEPIYNVGGVENTTIKEVAQIIANELNVEVIIPESEAKAIGAAKVERVSIKKYEEEFGNIEFLQLKEGIEKTINWMREMGYDKL